MNVSIEDLGVADMLNGQVEKIRNGLEKGLAQGGEIVKDEAKARCPVSTEKTRPGGPHGQLRSSIAQETHGNICDIGTNVEYAPYVEFGTYKMAAQPFLVPALKEREADVVQAIKDNIK